MRAGLAAVPARAAVNVVTDAAHPLATPALYRRVVDTVLAGADAAIAGLPLTEVVNEITITETATGAVVEAAALSSRNPPPHSDAACVRRRLAATPPPRGGGGFGDGRRGWGARDSRRRELANIHVTTPEEFALANVLAPAVLPTGATETKRSLRAPAHSPGSFEGKSDDHGVGGVHAHR